MFPVERNNNSYFIEYEHNLDPSPNPDPGPNPDLGPNPKPNPSPNPIQF